jgi:multidrug resistance protein, MATE family
MLSSTQSTERDTLRELRIVAALSFPVIVAELGWMFMGVVDTMMVGSLGSTAIGAVSVGGILFDAFAICGIGLLLGLDTLVSQAWGAGRPRDCDDWLWQGLYLGAGMSPVIMGGLQLLPSAMRAANVNAVVVELAVPYLRTMAWSVPPLLIYAAVRRYLQSISLVRPVMFTLVSANVVNAAGNYVLIPAYGIEGAGWATFAARVYMAGALAISAVARDPRLLQPVRINIGRIRELVVLGAPAAGQILLEVGVFAMAAVLAGRLTPDALAAHQVVLMIVGTTFMVPLGISSAAAVLVGQAVGTHAPRLAKHHGWLAVGLGVSFMAAMAFLFVTAPRLLTERFTENREVLAIAAQLLLIAAVFQVFDAIQVITTGALRGAGNTRTAMLANLMGHWLLGLPTGYALCFVFGFGVQGLWMGLSLGIVFVGTGLLVVWHKAHF